MFGIDFTEATNWGIPLGFLLLVDLVLGALAALKGGTFKVQWLYLFATTKGVAFAVGELLIIVGAVAPDLTQVDVAEGFFEVLGVGFLAPLAVSVVASIVGNVDQLRKFGDLTPPTGANPPVGEVVDGVPDEN